MTAVPADSPAPARIRATHVTPPPDARDPQEDTYGTASYCRICDDATRTTAELPRPRDPARRRGTPATSSSDGTHGAPTVPAARPRVQVTGDSVMTRHRPRHPRPAVVAPPPAPNVTGNVG